MLEEFIYRFGKRFDVRGNKGFCRGKMLYMKNIFMYFYFFYCLDLIGLSENGIIGDRMK